MNMGKKFIGKYLLLTNHTDDLQLVVFNIDLNVNCKITREMIDNLKSSFSDPPCAVNLPS